MKHLVIPDCQVKPGVSIDHLKWAGMYAVAKKPDVIIQIGDFADMESLSSYDVGKKSFEGRRYKDDIEVSHRAMEALLGPIWEYNTFAKKNHKERYTPRMILTLGNHEDRISRCVESDPKLEGVIGLKDLKYESYGWEVYPYLEPVVVDGIAYAHYFTSGVLGKPVTSAQALINKKFMSCIMGHVQGRSIAFGTRADGKQITGIFTGGFYQHDEVYLRWQGNAQTWRGIWMLHEVNDGAFDPVPVTLGFLKKKYSGTTTVGV